MPGEGGINGAGHRDSDVNALHSVNRQGPGEAGSKVIGRRLVAPAVIGMGVVGVLAWVHAMGSTPPSGLPSCPSLAVTGLLCPGCGMTRALFALMQGDLPRAMQSNALIVALIMVGVLGYVAWLRWASGRSPLRSVSARAGGWLGAMAAICVIVFVVARNMPPFAPYLSPG